MPVVPKRPSTNQFGIRPRGNPNPMPRYRHGQLITNGGFEAETPWQGWTKNSGVDLIITPEYSVHSGVAAARLGHLQPIAHLEQLISGIIPGRYYQLSFFTQAVQDSENAPLKIKLSYLDAAKRLLKQTALEITIEQFCLTDTAYTCYLDFTTRPTPYNARYVLLTIEINTTNFPQGAVLVDDVTLVAV